MDLIKTARRINHVLRVVLVVAALLAMLTLPALYPTATGLDVVHPI